MAWKRAEIVAAVPSPWTCSILIYPCLFLSLVITTKFVDVALLVRVCVPVQGPTREGYKYAARYVHQRHRRMVSSLLVRSGGLGLLNELKADSIGSIKPDLCVII